MVNRVAALIFRKIYTKKPMREQLFSCAGADLQFAILF